MFWPISVNTLKTTRAVFAIWLLGLASAHSVQLYPQDGDVLSAREFRELTNHHDEPCYESELQCLATHLWSLKCGAVVLEKLPMSDVWLIYSMHSGPKLPLDHVLYFMSGFLLGEDMDSQRWEDIAPSAIRQTVLWLDYQNWANTDLCELRAYWRGQTDLGPYIATDDDARSAALWQSMFRLIEFTQPATIREMELDATIRPRIFRETFDILQGPPCTEASPVCLAERLMYLECGAVLLERISLPSPEPLEQWYISSFHGSPIVTLEEFLYFSPEFFVGDLGSTAPFEGFESRIRIDGPFSREYVPNSQLRGFASETLGWLDSQSWDTMDLCELQSYWRDIFL